MTEFSINDRRGSAAPSNQAAAAFEATLRKEGISIARAREQTRNGTPFGDPRESAMFKALREGRISGSQRRTSSVGNIGSGMSMQMATQRPRDPMWYWKQNNLPINFTDPEQLKRVREFCNTPDAPVMMYDGTSQSLGDIQPGDEVMGWDYINNWNAGMRQRFVSSTVIAVGTRMAQVVQLEMASGATVKCTADHRWYNPYWTRPQSQSRWSPYQVDYTAYVTQQITEFAPAEVGTELFAPSNIVQIVDPGNWLVSVWAGQLTVSDGMLDKVVAVTPLGEQEVVSMQTTTGNYIVWGYCSKNCRLLNATHPIVSACISVYSQYPLQGTHLTCKDPQLVDFYGDLFFDQLQFEDFALDLGTEYWTTGESWGLGGWNETLGIWEADQLINPDDVEVERSLFLDEPRFLMRLPESLRKILTTRQPHWQYAQLMARFPELQYYSSEDSLMPVSNIVLKQLRFKVDRFSNRGLPILLRAMRTLIQEEMLNSALDSIADRLYTPLILTKLGAKASDLGTNVPWVPTQDDMDEFNAALDAALAADFRALTYHWAIDMQPVFGRENVPDLSNDFDRITERILMCFGLSQTMLTGACLTGDTEIHLNRASKGYRIRIDRLFQRLSDPDSMPGRRWRQDIPTYVARADGDVVRLGRMAQVWQSGIKEVYRVTTETGRSITASAEHPFRTERGWLRLKELLIGDMAHVSAGERASGGPSVKRTQRWIETRYHPYQSNNTRRNGVMRTKVLLHRAVMEAHLNELSIEEFGRILREDEIRSKELIFIPPSLHVHHRDHDHLNNELSNLEILTAEEHLRHHAKEDRYENRVLQKITPERIVSIEPLGEQMTYDIAMADEPHNFLANDFVVHNSAGETYAADALNRDVVSQLLKSYQNVLARYFHDRAVIVAEAQGHYDYEVRNGQRYIITEEIYEVDEESGEGQIVEQPKLLVPELEFKALNLTDEDAERQFVESLAQAGLPVPYRSRLQSVDIDFEEAVEQRSIEAVNLAVTEQETRRKTYLALIQAGLPVPQDLKDDFAPKAIQPNQQPVVPGMDQPLPGLDATDDLPALSPTPDELTGEQQAEQQGIDPNTGQPLDAEPQPPDDDQDDDEDVDTEPDDRPPESDEQRGRMPKKRSNLVSLSKQASLRHEAALAKIGRQAILEATAAHYVPPDNSEEDPERPQDWRPSGMFGAPHHVGMRRYVHVPDEVKAK